MHKWAIGNIHISIETHIAIFPAQLTMPFVPYFPIRINLLKMFIPPIGPQIIMGINFCRNFNRNNMITILQWIAPYFYIPTIIHIFIYRD